MFQSAQVNKAILSIVALAASLCAGRAYADVRVLGPAGSLLVYYSDGNDIVVRNCGDNYPRVMQRSDCNGEEKRADVEAFKQTLRGEFTLKNAEELRPMKYAELRVYEKFDIQGRDRLKKKEAELKEKLARIEDFIKQGAGDAAIKEKKITMDLLAQIRIDLQVWEAGLAAAQTVDALIQSILDKIAESQTMHKVADASDDGYAIYYLLRFFSESK